LAKSLEITDTLTDGLKKLAKENPDLARKGLGQAGLRMIADFVNEAPAMPLKEGFLRGSGAVFVEAKKVADSKTIGQTKGKPPSSNPDSEPLTTTVVFDTPYAARMDQDLDPKGGLQLGPMSRQAGNVGGGFISKKVASKKYQSIWAEIIANVLKSKY